MAGNRTEVASTTLVYFKIFLRHAAWGDATVSILRGAPRGWDVAIEMPCPQATRKNENEQHDNKPRCALVLFSVFPPLLTSEKGQPLQQHDRPACFCFLLGLCGFKKTNKWRKAHINCAAISKMAFFLCRFLVNRSV